MTTQPVQSPTTPPEDAEEPAHEEVSSESVEDSTLMRDIKGSPQIRERVTAIVMEHVWERPNFDLNVDIPIEGILWAVATNATIKTFVRGAMDEAAPTNRAMTTPAIIQIPDSMLSEVVMGVALPRLMPEQFPV